jgi:hypothetical protein
VLPSTVAICPGCTFKLTPLGKLVHQQMLAAHYLPADRAEQSLAMRARAELGRRYRGY